MNVDFFEESLFNWLDKVDYSKPVKKMRFKDKATVTFQNLGDKFYLNSIFVDEEHQGQGVANDLLRKFATEADNFKVDIVLEVVPMGQVGKKDLIRLYEKHGFKVTRFDSIPGMTRKAT